MQNNIRAIFVQRGMPMVRGQKAWALERFELLAQYRQPLAECSLDELWRGELDLELTELDQLRKQYLQVQKKLKVLALADERVRLLQTIPGVGRKTAEVVVAYLDDPKRFRTPDKYLPTPVWFRAVINPVRRIGMGTFTNTGPGNCAVRWSKRLGCYSVTTLGRSRCTNGSPVDRRPARRRPSWPWRVSYWCGVGSCCCVRNLGERRQRRSTRAASRCRCLRVRSCWDLE